MLKSEVLYRMKFNTTFFLFFVFTFVVVSCHYPSRRSSSNRLHPYVRHKRATKINEAELNQSYWFSKGQNILKQHLTNKLNTNIAKNVIMFLGDGMSLPTVTAARILQGQIEGQAGEENSLFFDNFPVTGLSHTYCIDTQVADSACTATAYLSGVKTNEGTIGVTAVVERRDCDAMANVSNHVYSIGKWAQDAGKATGIVTVTSITDASPAGVYAHTASRDWQDDTDVTNDGGDIKRCPDIAQQLVHGETGSNLNVIMGGGRDYFQPKTKKQGRRGDGVDLIKQWKQDKAGRNKTYVYLKDREDLLDNVEPTDYLLGLFARKHFNYNSENVKAEPSLAEMTEQAIKNLRQFPDGFFLFVEGGLIDKAHHENRARRALDETLEFDKAIKKAVDMTDEEDTLIIVTADHAHTMSFNGYPDRGQAILGLSGNGADSLPYTILSYSNGPGYLPGQFDGKRHDMTGDNIDDMKYRYPAAVPRDSETHGGDDVGVFARGPWSHLFTGSYEQNFIPYGMAFASCIGKGRTACNSWFHRT